MLKKTAYSLLFFLSLQFVLFSCCKEKTYLVNLQSIEIFNDTEDPITTTSEDLIVYLNIIYDYDDISVINATSFNFNTAVATTCPDNVYIYQSEFTDLNITADQEINGIAAGQSLNSIMKFAYYNIENPLDISQFYNTADNEENTVSKAPDSIILFFDETIQTDNPFNLTVSIENSNQDIFIALSNTYIIE